MASKAIDYVYRPKFRHWRSRRYQWFCDALRPQSEDCLLDIGGEPTFWLSYPSVVGRIDCLNLEPRESSEPIRTLVGDGCNLSFADQSYDIAFSNSVIEHVGTWEQQQRFAAEARRVGRKLWIQTPARECPIEPHYLIIGIHWLPRRWQRYLLRWLSPWGWLAKPTSEEIAIMVETTRLLTKPEMAQLFPDCEILTEYLLPGVPKSYIAVRA
ncbi:MAG: class I SAM-dependent methyltransferase [Synechococcaceae cyanobacterium SM2_3_60]|nr:class I SAM-dependent methyltransferase [Synechococcaceae cyanobacterium SM2_3_60]